MLSHLHHGARGKASPQQTTGFVWNWARRYDLMLAALTLGRERVFRRRIAAVAHLRPGETVLDVGCGTGSLALVAKQQVGASGRVLGIDPSPQMIARARHKARRRNLALDFQIGVIERLAFPNQSFDAVLSTFMMHHLPDDLKRRGLAEIARVLKPGGRVLVVDMPGHVGPWKSSLDDLPPLMKEAGFSRVETGQLTFQGLTRLNYALATLPTADDDSAV